MVSTNHRSRGISRVARRRLLSCEYHPTKRHLPSQPFNYLILACIIFLPPEIYYISIENDNELEKKKYASIIFFGAFKKRMDEHFDIV